MTGSTTTIDPLAPINYASAGSKIRAAKQKESRELVVNAGGTAYNALDDVMMSPVVTVPTKVAFGGFVESVAGRVISGEITEGELNDATLSALPAAPSPAPTPSPSPTPVTPTAPDNSAQVAAIQALNHNLTDGLVAIAQAIGVSVPLQGGAIVIERLVADITNKVEADKAAAAQRAADAQTEAVNAAKAEVESSFAGSVPVALVRQHAERLTRIVDSPAWKLGHRFLGAGGKVQVPSAGYTDLFNETNALRSDAGLPPLREETPATTPTPTPPASA